MAKQYARSSAEAQLYMNLAPCVCGRMESQRAVMDFGGGPARGWYSARCTICHTSRVSEFETSGSEHVGLGTHIDFGGAEASRLIDAGQWMTLAFEHVRRRPTTVQDLEVACAALREVRKFIPPGSDCVPDHAFWTRTGRAARLTHPERFRTREVDSYIEVFLDLSDRARSAPPLEPLLHDPEAAPPTVPGALGDLVEVLSCMIASHHGLAESELMRQVCELRSRISAYMAAPFVEPKCLPSLDELARLVGDITRIEAGMIRPVGARGGWDQARYCEAMQRIIDRVRVMAECIAPPSAGRSPRMEPAALAARLTATAPENPEDVCAAIIDIGLQGHPELADHVAPYLASDKPFLRVAAVYTLAFHLCVSAYRARIVRLLTRDPNSGVRAAAATGLKMFAGSDPELVGLLVDVALNACEAEPVRDAAFMSVLACVGTDPTEYPREAWVPGFARSADWALLARALTRVGIALPPLLAQRAANAELAMSVM